MKMFFKNGIVTYDENTTKYVPFDAPEVASHPLTVEILGGEIFSAPHFLLFSVNPACELTKDDENEIYSKIQEIWPDFEKVLLAERTYFRKIVGFFEIDPCVEGKGLPAGLFEIEYSSEELRRKIQKERLEFNI